MTTKTRSFPKLPGQRTSSPAPPVATPALDRKLEAVADTGPKADPRRDRGRIAFFAFLAVVAVSIPLTVLFTRQGTETEDQNEKLERVIAVECQPGGRFFGLPICTAISPSVQTQIDEDASGAGLDTAAVIQLVRAELARTPGQAAPADVETAARRVLEQNPGLYRGVQGPAGPTGASGATGAPGAPAEGPTDEQVRAAARAVMASDPEAFRGATGAQGVGVGSISFERRDGSCVAVVTLVDPADGATRQQTSPVGEAVCSAAPTEPAPGPVAPDQPGTGAAPEPTPEPTQPTTPDDDGRGVGDLLGG